jgi:ketosteroid isomerase-like protein
MGKMPMVLNTIHGRIEMKKGMIVVLCVVVLLAGMGLSLSPESAEKGRIKKVLSDYVDYVNKGGPVLQDTTIFAEDIVAFWSNGNVYEGRDAVVAAHKEGREEVVQIMTSFTMTPEDIKIHLKGDIAWLTCNLHAKGVVKETKGKFERWVRSTFVFEKRDAKWQMVHEHSTRIPKQ